jgi:[ribosomal protein S5]-alanine N-acetyltransferase
MKWADYMSGDVMGVIVINTGRLILRDFEAADWPAVHKYAMDAEVVRFQQWGPNSEAETREFINQVIAQRQAVPRLHYELAITLASSARLIGGCGIHITHLLNREGDLRCFLNSAYWNQGFAIETTRALLKFGFQSLKLHRLFATCAPANTYSERVLISAGMIKEGYIREHKLVKGHWRDSFLYSILEQEYQG